jgi:hypothetical protein
MLFMGLPVHIVSASQNRRLAQMKSFRNTNENSGGFVQGKDFLIWTGLWIVALLALLPR